MFEGRRMMSGGPIFRAAFLGLRAAGVAAVLHLTAAFVHAAAPSSAVVAIEPTRTADLVLLSSGFNAGLRQGMVCRVARGSSEIGEILLVDLRPSCSAALILGVAPRQTIRPGDIVTVKVLKS
ncbi:MAG TPA: hypothetical protein VGD88_10320 [Opitutaceae bacterium]